jgi:hypothetical protein
MFNTHVSGLSRKSRHERRDGWKFVVINISDVIYFPNASRRERRESEVKKHITIHRKMR